MIPMICLDVECTLDAVGKKECMILDWTFCQDFIFHGFLCTFLLLIPHLRYFASVLWLASIVRTTQFSPRQELSIVV